MMSSLASLLGAAILSNLNRVTVITYLSHTVAACC